MQYNAKTVLRLIPNVTLARLFAPYSAFAVFAWDAGSKGSADRIFERWQTMEEGEDRAVGRVLRQVHCLATPRGTRALIEAGRDRGANRPNPDSPPPVLIDQHWFSHPVRIPHIRQYLRFRPLLRQEPSQTEFRTQPTGLSL